MPELDRFYRDRKREVALLVVIEEEEAQTKEYLESHGLAPPLLYDQSGRLADFYGVHGLPTAIVVDSQGTPVARHQGQATWQELSRLVQAAF